MSYNGCKDSSCITQRKQSKAIAGNFIDRINNRHTTSYAPMLGIWDQSIVNEVRVGQMKDIQKCGGTTKVDDGCPCVPPVVEPTPPPIPGWATYMVGDPNERQRSSIGYAVSNGSVYVCGMFSDLLRLYDGGLDQNASPLNGTPTFFGSLGRLTVTQTLNYTAFLAKYSEAGVLQWVAKIGNTPPPSDVTGSKTGAAISIHADQNDGVFVTGNLNFGDNNEDDYFYAYPGTNDPLQQDNYSDGIGLPRNTPLPPNPYPNNEVYQYIFKYGSDGSVKWGAKIDSEDKQVAVTGVTSYGSDVYVIGTFVKNYRIYNGKTTTEAYEPEVSTVEPSPTTTSLNGFVIHYVDDDANNGIPTWTTTFVPSSNTDSIIPLSCSTNSTGVAICGSFVNDVTVYDANILPSNPLVMPTVYQTLSNTGTSGFVFKYKHSDGYLDWGTKVASLDIPVSTTVASVSCGPGQVFITGSFQGIPYVGAYLGFRNLSYVPTAGSTAIVTAQFTYSNQTTTFIIRYTETGNPDPDNAHATTTWTNQIGYPTSGPNNDDVYPAFGNSISYVDGYVYTTTVTGLVTNTSIPPPPPPPAIGKTNVYNPDGSIYAPLVLSTNIGTILTKYNAGDGTPTWVTRIDGAGFEYPEDGLFSGGVSAGSNAVYVMGVNTCITSNGEQCVSNNIQFYQVSDPPSNPLITFTVSNVPIYDGINSYNNFMFLVKYLPNGEITL